MLGLRDGHAIAGDDDHERRLLQYLGRAFDRFAFVVASARRRPRPLHLAEARRTSTLVNERFIARHMMIDRMKPLEPSSAPAVISSLLSSTKPIATADRPA